MAEGIFDHEFKKSVAKITLPIYKLRNAWAVRQSILLGLSSYLFLLACAIFVLKEKIPGRARTRKKRRVPLARPIEITQKITGANHVG